MNTYARHLYEAFRLRSLALGTLPDAVPFEQYVQQVATDLGQAVNPPTAEELPGQIFDHLVQLADAQRTEAETAIRASL